jgi:hypothetical protein
MRFVRRVDLPDLVPDCSDFMITPLVECLCRALFRPRAHAPHIGRTLIDRLCISETTVNEAVADQDLAFAPDAH